MSEKKIQVLKKLYSARKSRIEKRLAEFARIWREGSEKDIFAELAFCIFTPQSKAYMCDAAVKELREKDLLRKGGFHQVRRDLKGVRFPNNKTRFLLHARKTLTGEDGLNIRRHIDPEDPISTRNWLVGNIKGLGYKEASHFLRNIGLGEDLVILDVHIMRNMRELGLIDVKPKALSKKRYFQLEDKLKRFCDRIDIPAAHMDLLLWSKETGRIFK